MQLETVGERLAARADSLTTTEKELASHLVKHPELWGFSATTELAAAIGVHRSTLVRFAQGLGYTGFPDLREAVRADYLRTVSAPLELTNARSGTPFGDLIRSVYERELQNLRQTYEHVDANVLEAAARDIAGAEKVMVFGRRFSFTIAMHTSLLLRSLRPHVRLAPDPGGSSVDEFFDLDASDAALVFSLRRHSPEVQRAIDFLAMRGVATTLVTDAAPVTSVPEGIKVLHAYIGSTSTLDSFTSLVSLGHAIATVVSSLLGGADERQTKLEDARAHFQRPIGAGG